MRCPNCDAEMHQSEDDEDIWYCEECMYMEDRR